MLKILRRLTYTHNIKKDLWIRSLQKCSSLTESNIKKSIENFLIHESDILYVINRSKLPILKRYTEAEYAKAVILARTKDGIYTSLKELLLRTQINLDIFNQLCNSIIDVKLTKKILVTPDIKKKIVPNTILSIHVGQTALCWTLLNYDFKVLDWDCIIWQDNSYKSKMYDLMSVAAAFVHKLPPSDTYVIEDFQKVSKQLYDSYKLHIGIASCVKLILNQRPNSSITSTNDVYILNPLMTANFFHLILGTEVLATKYIMDVILNDIKLNNQKLDQVHIDDELKSKYKKLDNTRREQINWSLLKALTFAYLIRSPIITR